MVLADKPSHSETVADWNSGIKYEYANVQRPNKNDVLKPIQNFKIDYIQTKENENYSNIESFLAALPPF